tara:strand:+ start:15418 stop:15693 length:276 start_codon:yes stop_codon:yes gene_type:complete
MENNNEYSLVKPELELFDIEYRTWDEEILAKGIELIKDYVHKYDDLYIACTDFQIIIGEVDDIHGYNLNDIAQELEDLGFHGKFAQYRAAN